MSSEKEHAEERHSGLPPTSRPPLLIKSPNLFLFFEEIIGNACYKVQLTGFVTQFFYLVLTYMILVLAYL